MRRSGQDGGLRLVFGNQAERKMLDARHDFDDVSKLTKAEMARFEKEKVDDFKKALEDFADTMAARQREVRALVRRLPRYC
jgi:sorting nexin-1/2